MKRKSKKKKYWIDEGWPENIKFSKRKPKSDKPKKEEKDKEP